VGKIVNARKTTAKELLKLAPPVIICSSRPDFEGTILENGYTQVSLNKHLSSMIAGLDIKAIRLCLADKIREIIPNNSDPIYLTDYEMLFDPRYELDVLRLFIEISRKNKLIVKWCGKGTEESLSYAEQGFVDYKQYKISDYDVAIVI